MSYKERNYIRYEVRRNPFPKNEHHFIVCGGTIRETEFDEVAKHFPRWLSSGYAIELNAYQAMGEA